jgi:hypothetical protein
MSTNASNETEATGGALPQGIHHRLKTLHEYVTSLVKLARTRPAEAGAVPMGPEAVGICLGVLEEQIGQVVEVLGRAVPGAESGPAIADEDDLMEGTETLATEAEATYTVTPEAPPKKYIAGITLAQMDDIGRLLDSLHALGNVVACSDHAELTDITLSIMGDGIYRDVGALREIMNAIDDNTLDPPIVARPSVREEGAIYLARPVPLSPGHTAFITREHPTYQ